jgi:Zn-dependent protease with chaperone function
MSRVWQSEASAVFADYVDGEDARFHRVALHLMPVTDPTTLRLTLPDGHEEHWPLERLRRLRDQAAQNELVLSLDGQHLARLRVQGAAIIKELEGLAPSLNRRAPIRNKRRLVKWSLAAVGSVALIIFGLVPLLAAQLALLLPPEGEQALGDATFEQIRSILAQDAERQFVKICEDEDGLDALAAMLTRLDPSEDLPYPLRVHVLDHKMVNAFALPGGRVILFRGLLDDAANPDEVAAVLAHEIGHVVGRDPTRDALRSAGSIGVLGLLFGDFAGGSVVLFMANQLINASYSQAAETAADEYAHVLMTDAGLSPAALGTFFARLHEEHGDESALAAHFSSHPQMLERIEAAAAASADFVQNQPVLSPAEWSALRGICGINPPIERRPQKGSVGGGAAGSLSGRD